MMVFLTLICLGQAVFALGVTLKKFWLALLGRLIFGFGGESLSVAQSTLLAGWFRGKEVAFAMGINLSISRIGSVVNDNVSPAAYEAWSLAAAIWVGFFICCVSLCATITLVCIDRYARRKTKEAGERQKPLEPDLTIQATTEEDKPKVAACDAFKKVAVDIIHDVRTFSSSYWLLLASCVVVYASILPFNGIASNEISDKYLKGDDTTTADHYLMIPFLISAVCSPFLGGAVDLFGRRAILLTMSASFLVLAHLLLGFAYPPPWLPMVIIGLSYSVYAAAMWPSVSYIVEQRTLGTAYGLITAVQNAGLAAVPLGVAAIKGRTEHGDKDPNAYRYVELFFACFAFCGVITGTLLNIIDARHGHVLNRSTARNPVKPSDTQGNGDTGDTLAEPLLPPNSEETPNQVVTSDI